MKKRSTKILSLVLALIMVFSLVPVSAYAAPKARSETGVVAQTDGPSSFFGDLGRLIKSWGKILSPKPFMPAITLVSDEFDGVTVTVKAPTGALPEGTTMEVKPVSNMDAVQAAVDETPDVSGTALIAADITFFDADGNEIQPAKAITVAFSSDELAGREDLTVVHLDLGADELGENEVPAEPVESTVGTNAVIFQARHFSVYAVIGDGETGDNARVTVNFHRTDGTVETMYVKNSDTAEEIEVIVFDPGCGPVDSDHLFAGWTTSQTYDETTTRLTIDNIQETLKDMTIAEGTVIDYYPILLKIWTITYIGEKDYLALGTDVILVVDSTTSANYRVNMPYGTDGTQHFEGWHIADGRANIQSATYGSNTIDTSAEGALLPNGTQLVVKGNIKLSVHAPKGYWLVFNENGKGATYCAPQFLEENEPSVRPRPDSEMKRSGYDFGGWYTDAACTDGNEFTFGGTISEQTNVYAKWTVKPQADYIILIWKQNLACDGYDFIDSVSVKNAASNSPITGVTISGDTASVNGTSYSYTGFTTKEITYQGSNSKLNPNNTVAPDGSTVVNVYFDRKEYTLNFTVPASNYITYVYGGREYSDAAISNTAVTNQSTITTLENNKKTITGFEVSYTGGNNNRTYYVKKSGSWYQITNDGYYVYNASYILRLPSSGGTVKTITAKYEQVIANNFPIVGSDGVTYEHGERWKPGTNSAGWSEVMVLIDTMPASNCTFTLDVAQRPLKTMYYYVEALASDTNTVTYKGTRYRLYTEQPISARYNGVTEEDFLALSGFDKLEATDENGNVVTPHSVSGLTGQYYIASTTQDQSIYFYYTRQTANILYRDGIYKNGNNIPVENGPANQGIFNDGTVTDIPFGSSLATYNEGGDDYYDPTEAHGVNGYMFGGWYLDEACSTEAPYTFTTLPQGGLTLYAKWVQIQYRVYLHSGVPESDSTLSWGDEGRVDENGDPDPQAMCFRVTYGDKVSAPEGTRSRYLMHGWFTDEGGNDLFNAELTPLTEATVSTAYDRETEYTDTYNKYGNLTDPKIAKDSTAQSNRFWITKKLDLYATWRAKTDGAEGIGVVYDLNGGSNPSTIADTMLYQDDTRTVAQGAPEIAPSSDLQFLHWEIWTVDTPDVTTNNYVRRENMIVYPGGDFKVYLNDALKRENGVDEDGHRLYTYTVKLVAVYGPKKGVTPTHITWYANGGVYDPQITGEKIYNTTSTLTYIDLLINQAIDIPGADHFNRTGYKFLGWAKSAEPADAFDGETKTVDESQYSEITDLTLWLKAKSNGKYDELNADGTVKNADVEQVAADERTPYDALYAVWEREYFYIYHSASGKLEAVPMPTEANATFDLTAKVYNTTEAPHLYGGYYKSCGGVTEANVNSAKTGAKAAADHMAAVTDAVVYTGDNLKNGDVRFWSKKLNGAVNYYDELGTAMTPSADTVYYLKEVPVYYLQTNAKWVYNMYPEMHNKIEKMYFLTCVDDTFYSQVGFAIAVENKEIAKLASSFSWQRSDADKPTTITSQQLCGHRGYIGVVNASSYITTIGSAGADSPVSVIPYWVTLDGVEVSTSGYNFYSTEPDKDLNTSNIRYEQINP